MWSSSVALLTTGLLPLIAAQTYPISPYSNQTIVYKTTYIDVCPTGLTTIGYTLTQTCTLAACVKPTTVPDTFTVTTKVCNACAGKPTITVTCPIVSVPTGTYNNGTVPCNGAPNCVGPVPTPGPTPCVNCPPGVVTTVAPPPATKTPGCGSGVTCPPGNNTPPFVSAGAEGRFASGVEVLALSVLVGVASSILLL